MHTYRSVTLTWKDGTISSTYVCILQISHFNFVRIIRQIDGQTDRQVRHTGRQTSRDTTSLTFGQPDGWSDRRMQEQKQTDTHDVADGGMVKCSGLALQRLS